MSLALANEQYIRRERQPDKRIPYTLPLDDFVTRTREGHYVQTLRLGGASFKSADGETLTDWRNRLNMLWVSLASPQVAFYSHVIHRRDNSYPEGDFPPGFACDLNSRYRADIIGRDIWRSDLYLSVVYMPDLGRMSRGLRAAGITEFLTRQREALEDCRRLREDLLASLAIYAPEALGAYQHGDEVCFAPHELYGFLVNGEWQREAYPTQRLDRTLTTSQPIFGDETIEYRTPTHTRYGAMLGLIKYGAKPWPDMMAPLLSQAPFPYVMTQSFSFIEKAKAEELIRQEYRVMLASGDFSAADAEDMVEVQLAELKRDSIAVGSYHFSLQVQTDLFDGVRESAAVESDRLRQLGRNVTTARTLLREAGLGAAREGKLVLEGAFYGQLPGNFQLRPRLAHINTRNFSSFVSFHNYPAGQGQSRWDHPLTMYVSDANTPYLYSPHVADVGHAALIGPTGSGKTTKVGFDITMARKYGATIVIFDKGEGLHVCVRRNGGVYCAIKSGIPTGRNPLQRKPTPANHEFLRLLLRRLVTKSGQPGLSASQEENLDNALRTVFFSEDIAWEDRRLSRVLNLLNKKDDDGPYARLLPWCEGGDYGWVFDNETDAIEPMLRGDAPMIGFGIDGFINNPMISDALSMDLWNLTETLADSRRLIVVAEEADKLFANPYNTKRAQDLLETGRSRNLMLWLCFQTTGQVINSSIAGAVIEQCHTKAFFANPNANETEYTSPDKFGRSKREFNLIKHKMNPADRQFLLCQGRDSIRLTLRLRGYEEYLGVLSGNAKAVALMESVIAEHGGDPEVWGPYYQAIKRGATPQKETVPCAS